MEHELRHTKSVGPPKRSTGRSHNFGVKLFEPVPTFPASLRQFVVNKKVKSFSETHPELVWKNLVPPPRRWDEPAAQNRSGHQNDVQEGPTTSELSFSNPFQRFLQVLGNSW
jgi:hypothetical protein